MTSRAVPKARRAPPAAPPSPTRREMIRAVHGRRKGRAARLMAATVKAAPDRREMSRAVDGSLEALGLEGHEALVVADDDIRHGQSIIIPIPRPRRARGPERGGGGFER